MTASLCCCCAALHPDGPRSVFLPIGCGLDSFAAGSGLYSCRRACLFCLLCFPGGWFYTHSGCALRPHSANSFPPQDVNRSTRTQALFESIQTINRNPALSRIVLCGFLTRLALVQLVESPNLYISNTLTTMLN